MEDLNPKGLREAPAISGHGWRRCLVLGRSGKQILDPRTMTDILAWQSMIQTGHTDLALKAIGGTSMIWHGSACPFGPRVAQSLALGSSGDLVANSGSQDCDPHIVHNDLCCYDKARAIN